MRRITIGLCLLLLLGSPLSAGVKSTLIKGAAKGIDAFSTNTSHAVEIGGETVRVGGRSLSNLKKTFETYDFSILPHSERVELYNDAKLSIAWPAFRNLTVGFGKGSELQGDTAGEWFGIISDGVSIAATGVGITLLLFDFIFIFPGHAALGEEYWFGSSDKLLTAALTTTFAGAGAFALGRVIQAILPLSYGSRYNKTLREGLGLGKKMEDTFIFEVGAAPTMERGVLLAARVAF